MNQANWDEFDFGNDENIKNVEHKSKSQQRRKKWREIEDFKERQRLKRELAEYDSYNM